MFLSLNHVFHPPPEYLYKLKLAFLSALLVAMVGLVLAATDVWRSRRFTSAIFALISIGFLCWFPWDVLPRIIAL